MIPLQMFESRYSPNLAIFDQKHEKRQTEILRFFRIIKIIKLLKYQPIYKKMLKRFDITVKQGRIVLLLASSILLAHLFACMFYVGSKYNDFAANTWVN
jgi:hypothetical protein